MTGERILIVEDEGIVADEIKSRLEHLGYHVVGIAMTGQEAIDTAFSTFPDLILMDIMLKGDMDGVGAAHHIRDRMDIPVIYLTAYGDQETLQRAKISEPFGYILKPFKERELAASIEVSLYRHRMEKELFELGLRYQIVNELTTDFSFSIRLEPDNTMIFEWPMDDFTKITGYPASEFRNPGDFLRLLAQEDQEDVLRMLDSHLAGQTPYFECSIITKPGEQRWIRCYCRSIRNEVQGRLIRIYGAVQDITAYKQQENSLRQQVDDLNLELDQARGG
jgi:PAS domain S-box-containing protein